jgi:uncharacterized protein (TIGR02266 family)
MGNIEALERGALTEEQSFERMRVRLRDLANAAPPCVDPRALAMRALLVTDRLGQPDLLRKVHSLGRAGACEPRSVDDLRVAARALLHVLSQLGEPARGPRPPEELFSEALRLRRAGVEALETIDSDDARLWIGVFGLPFDDADLAFDLRSLVRLYEEYGEVLGTASVDAAQAARRCADVLESGPTETLADNEWRPWLARTFSLTVSLYDDVCRIGRFVTATGGAAFAFPSLASIAGARRRSGGPTSHERVRVEHGLPVAEPQMAPPPVPVSPPPLSPAGPPAPPSVATPADLEQAPPVPEVPAPALQHPRLDEPTRREGRFNVEIEVNVLSDSNFYVGFTENLSGGGLFIATYFVRPLGSKVEMCVRVPGRGNPLMLMGEVRWIREASASDAWPGMGIQFDAISEEDRVAILGFLATRDPLFFVE